MRAPTTSRLILKPLTAADLDGLHRLYGDAELMRYITGAPRTLEQTRERLAAHMEDHRRYGFGLYATYLKDSDEMIGRCGIEPRPTRIGLEGDLAWMFARPYWGLGLGSEVAMALIDFGIGKLGLVRVFARADHVNTRSIDIMKKLGMTLASTTPVEVEYEVRRSSADLSPTS